MTNWRCQINGSNDTHHPTRVKNYWHLRFQIELPTWVSQPLGDTLTNETGFGVTLSALQWMIKKKDGCKWCIKDLHHSKCHEQVEDSRSSSSCMPMHRSWRFESKLSTLSLLRNLLPFSPSTHHPAPALSLHPAQSSKPYKSKSLPSHSPEASEQLHGPHSLDVDLQAPYARMGGLRRPGFQARQRGTSKRVDVLLYHLAGKYSLHGSCKTTQFARIMPGPKRIT